MSCHGAGRWARTARYSGCSKKPWRGRILAEPVGEAGHGVEPAPVDGERAHAVERRGLPVDGAGGGPGGAPGELILADLVRSKRGGPRGAAEEGDEMGGPAARGALGSELPDLVVLEVGVDEDPQGRPLEAERARGRRHRAGGTGGGLSSRSCAGSWAGSLLGGGRGQAASVHIRSDGPHREAECATAKARRCGGSHEWRPSAHIRSANSAGAPAPPCGPAGP